MIQILLDAKETVHTVTFRKKVDLKGVEKALEGFAPEDLSSKEIF